MTLLLSDGRVPQPSQQNIILLVGKVFGHMVDAVKAYEQQTGNTYRIAVLLDINQNKKLAEKKKLLERLDIVLSCDLTNDQAIQKALLPHISDIAAITCRGEDSVPLLAKVVPHVPYINAPTSESLAWSTDKLLMRQRLKTHDKSIAPAYMIVNDTVPATLKKIEEKVGFPLVAKPAGLAASRLVSICYHREELEDVLKKTFKKISTLYKETHGRWEPKVLVEQFMDGDMYSIDGYISRRGTARFCPMVHIKTGKTIGFDDFFGYQQMTPTLLKKESIEKAEQVATEAVHALGLRSTTVHIELMKTEAGWKIIELGPRIGGFRHLMYELSYGINHTMNDILTHLSKKPHITKKVKGYTVAMKFFAKKEGRLTKLNGIKKAQGLGSFKKLYQNKKIGDQCQFAKHGGSSVFDIVLFNEKRSELLADIRRLEKAINIETA